jgi:membrane associated rhomboid family serine protease
MGLYDREYYRESARPGFGGTPVSQWSAVTTIIVINFMVWGVDAITQLLGGDAWFYKYTAGRYSDLYQPWYWWRIVTLAFTHSPDMPQHIIFNMLLLFFLGRGVEARIGKAEFWRTYLAAVVFSSVVGLIFNYWGDIAYQEQIGQPVNEAGRQILAGNRNLGASGAVMAVAVMLAVYDPFRTILIYFVLPVPIWLLVTILVIVDLVALSDVNDGVSHAAHVSGALYGYLYAAYGWNLGQLMGGGFSLGGGGRSRIRIHDPDKPQEPEDAGGMDAEVDRILAKLAAQGEASLTNAERKTLEDASRYYQRRRK